jgi:RNA polymerase sigma-70 factor (ECF subfamily)
VLGGEVDAFAALVARYREKYTRFAVQMLGRREDAEEALQDAFVRSFRSLAHCREPARFDAWLFRILINRCRTAAARRARRERTVVLDEAALNSAAEPHPSERMEWDEEISRALADLPADQREAFLLKHVEQRSYEEMADLTGVGVSALKMRVSRACDALRRSLGEVRRV